MSGHATTTFASRLREAQGDLATEKLARQVDVSLRVVQKWRSGQVEPSGASLARLCLTLGQPVEFFYPGQPDGEKAA